MEKSKVAVLLCDDYREDKVYETVKAGFEMLGGTAAFTKPEEKILLKPNLVRGAAVERAVITHPSVMKAVARVLAEAGHTKISCGDSCGFGVAEKIMQESGMQDGMKPFGVQTADFSKEQRVSYENGGQKLEFVMAEPVCSCDALISVCKMKTHALEHITGAVKNQYGCIAGLHKAQGHTRYPDADSFARMLIHLNQCIQPRLFICDGIVAMEGNGPTSGDPVPMGMILMSADPIALDTTFAHLIHLNPEHVPTIVHGSRMGLGHSRTDEIELLIRAEQRINDRAEQRINDQTEQQEEQKEKQQEKQQEKQGKDYQKDLSEEMTIKIISMKDLVEQHGNPDFQVDRSRSKGRGILGKIGFLRVFRKKPYIDPEICRKCGICVEACPVEEKAVNFTNGRKAAPVYDYKKCIRCFCCQEMCPHKAIKVK